MQLQHFFYLGLLFLKLSCTSQQQKINGVSFVASRDSITQAHVLPVLNVNSNSVALMPFGFIKDINAPKVMHNTDRQWFGETEAGLLQYARLFAKNNVKVMVKPQIWVWNGTYTGLIKMTSETDWQALEKSYTAFILTYAKAAELLNAEVFCIGTELELFVANRPKYWQQLITQIRKIYTGKLTYASNWDEFTRVPFWQDLDFVGIDAYFPLSDKKTPTVQELEIGWQSHKKAILKLYNSIKKPILFTEFGYRSVHFTAKEPWQSNRIKGNVNLVAQTNGLQAIHKQFWQEDWFAGGFVWKWFHNHNKSGGTNNNRFTLQNKPAEQLLKKLYAQ